MFKSYLKLIRIPHWIKNLFVFIPLIFSKSITEPDKLFISILAFFAFSVASSIIYVFNDIVDKESDSNHPSKKNRPIASGAVSIRSAIILILILSMVLILLIAFLSLEVILIIIFFLFLNLLYTIKLKEVVILDILLIATGFILRVVGGAVAIDVYISSWLILTTLFLSLFLAIMKRRSELNLVGSNQETRKVLTNYSNNFIDQISTVSASGVIICYALYSVSERTIKYFNTELLIFTTVFVIFGIFRYMFIVYNNKKGEDPTKEIIMDIPMLTNLVLYIFSILVLAYWL